MRTRGLRVGLMAFALTACPFVAIGAATGQPPASGPAAPAPAAPPPSSSPAVPAASGAARPIVYGGNGNFPPYEYIDASGRPNGFNVALIHALAAEEGVAVTVSLGAWRERLAALERGEIDLVTMAVTDERLRRFGLLLQTWTLQQSIVFRGGRRSYPRGLDELGAESIAIEPRALMDDLLRQLPEVRRPVIVAADNQVDALQRVLTGQASGAAGNSLALRYTANGLGARDLVEVPVKSLAYHFATQRGREAEFSWLEPALAKLRASGHFERLVEQHLALPTPRSASPVGWYLLVLTGGVALLWLGTFAWTRSLQRQVRVQTVQLRKSLDDRESLARVLQGMLEGTASVTGEAFFFSLVRNLGEALDVSDAMVAEIVGGDGAPQVRTIAIWRRKALSENVEYPLAGTAVEHVLRHGLYYCESGIAERFPHSQLLQGFGVSSFLGAPLIDAGGVPRGVLAVLNGAPIAARDRAETAVRIFAARAAAELERQRAASALARTSRILGATSGIQSRFISKAAERGAFDEMLDEVLAFSESRYGFVSEVVHDAVGAPALNLLAVTGAGVDDITAVRPPLDSPDSIVAEAILADRAVICNDAARVAREEGVPMGHPPLESLLAMPVHRGDRLVGLIGAANRPGGYDEALAGSLHPFLATCGLLIEAHGADLRRRVAEEDRRQLEAQVQHAQKLESLGVLAGGIAHDFNNLLVGVLGHAELARMELDPDSPLAERLGHIETAALRASELTNQMLAYSGKGRFLVESVDLTRLVREMAQLLDVSISKKAQLRYEFSPHTPAIDADQAQIRQVVMNLLTNASEAIGDQEGQITIRIGTTRAAANDLTGSAGGVAPPPGDYVFLEVVDTGCGMDDDTAARIFDPFFTTKFTGRGLGLAATLGIVRSHGGGVRIRSTPGAGSIFTVLFPYGRLGVADAPAARPPAPEADGNGIVLVVDDEPDVRRVAQTALSRAGLSVLTASNGREALAVIEARGDDIKAIVLDMTMPIMGGDEVLARLRTTRPDVGVLLSSGYTEPEVTRTIGAHYDCTFIQKPYRSTTLVEEVRRLLARGGERRMSASS
jgi:signal transduction histidine kinase/CheY-like chemotaxis protein/ABC-type amino acid transport substrate-binding protein